MNNYLINDLKDMVDEKIISFHVPGHKNGRIIENYYKKYFSNIFEVDTTEIPGTDNLHNPLGGIKKSQEKISKLYKSDKSYILINGTTGGILSMILASTKNGDKILMGKNSHKSIFNGAFLGHLNVIFYDQEIHNETGLVLNLSPQNIEKKILENPDIKVIIITYPSYNGICSDIGEICKISKKYNKILLVDEAHGAHLFLDHRLPKSSIECGADIVVQSTHKSLPAFTQSSLLHFNSKKVDVSKLEMMLGIFQSSSPSYLLMSSVDIAMEIVEKEGKDLMNELIENIIWFKKRLHEDTKFRIVDKTYPGFENVYKMDLTKINILTAKEGYKGVEVEDILRRNYQIQAEFSTNRTVLFIGSIANKRSDFELLLEALISISGKRKEKEQKEIFYKNFELEKKYSMWEAFQSKGDFVEIFKAEGEVTLEFVIPYPPGIPIAVPGEILSKEIIDYIIENINEDSIIGLADKTLNTIKIMRR